MERRKRMECSIHSSSYHSVLFPSVADANARRRCNDPRREIETKQHARARAQTYAAVCDVLWKGSATQSALVGKDMSTGVRVSSTSVSCAGPIDGSHRLNHGQTSESTEIDVKQTGAGEEEQEVNSNLRNSLRC